MLSHQSEHQYKENFVAISALNGSIVSLLFTDAFCLVSKFFHLALSRSTHSQRLLSFFIFCRNFVSKPARLVLGLAGVCTARRWDMHDIRSRTAPHQMELL